MFYEEWIDNVNWIKLQQNMKLNYWVQASAVSFSEYFISYSILYRIEQISNGFHSS